MLQVLNSQLFLRYYKEQGKYGYSDFSTCVKGVHAKSREESSSVDVLCKKNEAGIRSTELYRGYAMIYTSMQLKAKIRNMSGGDSRKALTLIRNYLMECFLERVSKSKYRDKFILKGGMLVAAIVGLDTRATMDIDTTVRAINLTMENAREVIQDIISVGESEPVNFSITKMTEILEGHDYGGIRITLEASLETMRQTIQIDISTGDVITPRAIEYSYPLMF